jgi:hypothetical protein
MEMTKTTYEPHTDLTVTVEIGDPVGLAADGRVTYRVEINGVVFEGDDFRPSPLYASDGPEAVAALLSFLAAYGEDLWAAGEGSDRWGAYSKSQRDVLIAEHEYLSLLAEVR